MDKNGLNLRFSEFYKDIKSNSIKNNPFYNKIVGCKNLTEIIQFEQFLQDKWNSEKHKYIIEALYLCKKIKEQKKSVSYKKYINQGSSMFINKKFEEFLENSKLQDISENLKNILDVLTEKSPPSGSAKKFSEDPKVKGSFRSRYGKDWKSKMYATAWKMYKDNKDSNDIKEGVLDDPSYNKQKTKKFKGSEKDYKKIDTSVNRKRAKENRKKGITTKKSKERHKGMHFKGPNEIAAIRFWNYRKANPKYRDNPVQTGMNPNKKDGDIKGRFVRYYGAKGQKSRNKKPAGAIRSAIARLIAQGKWPSENARKALAAGRKKRWSGGKRGVQK